MAAKNDKNVGSTLTISGLQVAVTHERVPIDEIQLDPNNPRIRLQIRHGNKKKPATAEDLLSLVQCAALFCTYPAAAAKAALARVTLARMSLALAVQMNGLGSML